ncbi:sugar nucleotide-binding protein [Rhodococcus triatomae]|uniref:Nucleoside-diphosphate-sugar epimerase n=1 Tax=Rhodococcus triatomae TaxID=300028 RepID=A0A1G8NFU6_9NOCA|nr:SDR family oxidoreductase [Rhodococcus triatomae]QNG19999.1 sugar nucleotide-binding protein [Rhodococcus triatomae]QNG24086.1 sugar nucleotide-binding protein [Rhodococcus triatomae]SDI79141.1 Nucleoside-diphosphate-sugar epimerase [Rhodococcus triatomae]
MSSDQTKILVTGASGVIGRSLLEALRSRSVVALEHQSRVHEESHVQWVRGDVTATDLGLGEQYDAVAASVTHVVHIAAAVDFNVEPQSIETINLGGTRNVVAFARAAGAPLVHVSTAFVDRREQALSVSGCADGRDAYLRSKTLGEQVVRESGLDYAIVRPSLLAGDVGSGEIPRHQGLHAFLGAYAKGALPFVPFPEDTYIDFVPRDVVAAAIARLLSVDLTGQELWLTAGRGSLTARALVDLVRGTLAPAGVHLDSPRFFPTETVQRLLQPAFFSELEGRDRNKFEHLLAVASVFADEVFPSDLGKGELSGLALSENDSAALIEATVDRYWTPALREAI